MSDFFNSGWSTFIAIATVGSLVACLALLVIASRRTPMAKDNTTGHVWDQDLVELNNPLPRWWMVLFVLTVVCGGAYVFLYPGLGSSAGTLNWTSTGQYEAEQKKANDAMAAVYARYVAQPAEVLAKDAGAMGIGERLFVNNCAACHGSDARGSKGFPNLTDSDWLYGGSLEAIKETIAKGRTGNMPPMAAAVGSSTDVGNLAHYVLSLSGSPHNAIQANEGRAKFAACAACHGVGGRGNPALGAPNLADKVWLHGWGEDAIVSIVNKGKVNVMPAHDSRLTPGQIHVLGAYVWSLSHGSGTSP
ncbi:cytochrome-c oxidase, cbb3-type subunit III [Piscinibacter sp. HJYY11]|uniref:cytochrome-c oxidase, cbb3-type subunit III n=1 Tax=Piscinibacter sp. HJYY11 TaxID=2801333 RepID=UPI00191FDF1C|nr:cytochrome-c oxidase, cbb3-type subunit III [Piscinibacter sp. HJYY11]MBL0726411.1 cytochrome-c oxidase, cbb3-type subunit III [Piscinibacter sp. HJYY11]